MSQMMFRIVRTGRLWQSDAAKHLCGTSRVSAGEVGPGSVSGGAPRLVGL